MRLVLRRYAPVKRLQRFAAACLLASVLRALATLWGGYLSAGKDSGIEPLAASGESSERGGGGPGEEACDNISAMKRPSWLGRAVGNRHHHAIEEFL